MTTVLKFGETVPKGRVFSYEWCVTYQFCGQRYVAEYKTENKGGNAWHAVLRRFKKDWNHSKILSITCD